MRIQHFEAPIAERVIFPVKNADTSTINAGTPLVLNLSNTAQPSSITNGRAAGSEDGFQVVLPSTAGAVPSQVARYGVALGNIRANAIGETMIHGATNATVVLQTRANSTTAWAATTLNSGGLAALSVDTVNNAFALYTTLPANDAGARALLLDSSSMASSASAASDTRTVITIRARVFVRMM